MTAEHDDRERYDGLDEEETDALFAVLMDEPLTDEQRADPAFLAEHRAAATDLALLREQLGIIGDALAGPPPAAPRSRQAPRPRPAARRRPWQYPGVRALGLAGALAAAFAGAVFGIGWLAANGGSSAMSNGASSDKAAGSASGTAGQGGAEQTAGPGYLACARLVVEGTVTGVRQLPGSGEERVTLRVTRAYKPAKTAGEVEFLFEADTDTRIREGARLLVGITRGQQVPDRYAVGEPEIAPERSWIVRDLPESRTLTCRK
ncbi:hypothetical protein [Streptomyces fuscichromogenes]|uniref:Uncharacterized protein n=1 Tax=Streptomyces fuscichromogenes TaxID=1324013 RepID=A0A917UIU8_9ACTN|nr:hypothetical protein [Streptomyces fuscichromogenes]GGM92795.1 hypothetical protein GCM10011578_011010 [Streptomyces fuscichromogenes]